MVPSKRAQDDDVRAQHAQYVCLVLFGRMPAPCESIAAITLYQYVPVLVSLCRARLFLYPIYLAIPSRDNVRPRWHGGVFFAFFRRSYLPFLDCVEKR